MTSEPTRNMALELVRVIPDAHPAAFLVVALARRVTWNTQFQGRLGELDRPRRVRIRTTLGIFHYEIPCRQQSAACQKR